MQARIFKYELNSSENKFQVPGNACVRMIAEQDGKLFAWIEHDHEEEDNEDEMSTIILVIIATGQIFQEEDLVYIQSVVMSSGLVWHVYEKEG